MAPLPQASDPLRAVRARSGRTRLQQHERSAHRAVAVPLAYFAEAGLAQDLRQTPLHVVAGGLEAIDEPDGQGEPAHEQIARRAPVGQHQAPAGAEHPGSRVRGGPFGIAVKMVK